MRIVGIGNRNRILLPRCGHKLGGKMKVMTTLESKHASIILITPE